VSSSLTRTEFLPGERIPPGPRRREAIAPAIDESAPTRKAMRIDLPIDSDIKRAKKPSALTLALTSSGRVSRLGPSSCLVGLYPSRAANISEPAGTVV